MKLGYCTLIEIEEERSYKTPVTYIESLARNEF
jgi:hypothetical protein